MCDGYRVGVRPREGRVLCDWHDPWYIRYRGKYRGGNVYRLDMQRYTEWNASSSTCTSCVCHRGCNRCRGRYVKTIVENVGVQLFGR